MKSNNYKAQLDHKINQIGIIWFVWEHLAMTLPARGQHIAKPVTAG